MVDTSAALTRNAFLGGALQIYQPEIGYRAGIDPVILAASVPARAGQNLLDLGCGVGVAALCVGRRVPGVALAGLELQANYAELARRNGMENGLDFEVITGDLAAMPPVLRERRFDHVIANPPYFNRSSSTASRDSGREIALGEDTPLTEWLKQAAKRCAPGGTVSVIQRAERLPELLAAADGLLGSLEVMPLIPRRGRSARLVILRARKGGRADFRLHDGWLLHEGPAHNGDRDDYTKATGCILRNGAALPFPD